jgi:hypothetical protein
LAKIDQNQFLSMDSIEQILSTHLHCGLYRNEDKASWKPFLATVDSITRGNDCPRNIIIKLWQEDHLLLKDIESLGLLYENNIAKTYLALKKKLRTYPVATLKDRYETIKTQHQELLTDVVRLKHLSEQLAKGGILLEDMLKKKQESIDHQCHELENAQKYITPEESQLQEVVDRTSYYYNLWITTDKEHGEINRVHGESLEQKSHEKAFQYIQTRHGKIHKTWHNVLWYSGNTTHKHFGEVDIVMLTDDGYIIIEVKSRVFDIMSGWLQNGPHRARNKRYLALDERVLIPYDITTYVITTLPELPYKLPIESLLKKAITYRVKHDSTDEETWDYAKALYGDDRMSPLQWYVEFARPTGIIILI